MENSGSRKRGARTQDQGALSRRKFLGRTAEASAFTIVSPHVLGGPEHIPPSEKITLAGIGMGGQGVQNMTWLQQFPENPEQQVFKD